MLTLNLERLDNILRSNGMSPTFRLVSIVTLCAEPPFRNHQV